MLADTCAGFIVAMTLVPQALSYAALARLTPIHGLYSSLLPPIMYYFFGSSPILSVGPVSLVALMTRDILEKKSIDYSNEDAAIGIASNAALSCGIMLCTLAIFNAGSLASKIPHSVVNAFTVAAAVLIALNQVKSAVRTEAFFLYNNTSCPLSILIF